MFYDRNIKIDIKGTSHGPYIEALIEGFPEGFLPDMEYAADMLKRRAPGQKYTSKRKEADVPVIISGVSEDGSLDGTTLIVRFANNDVRDEDYSDSVLRPGHGDYPYYVRTGKLIKGGATSSRFTVGVVFAGALAKQLLSQDGIFVNSRLLKVGDVFAEDKATLEKFFKKLETEGNSAGGIVETTVYGLRTGFCDPAAGKIESLISRAVFNIPAVKGLEFGAGFDAASMYGSENNDEYYIKDGNINLASNNCGGLLGGMAAGTPLVFRTAFKPTPSIAIEQNSVDIKNMQNVKVRIKGRHDPCVAIRGTVVVEAAAAIALYDCLIGSLKDGTG